MKLTGREFRELQKKRVKRGAGESGEIGGATSEREKIQGRTKDGVATRKSGIVGDFTGDSGKRSKYNARETWVDGIRFDSRKEAARWNQLVMLERAGVIMGLRRQVPYVLIDKSAHGRAIRYIADFAYMQDGQEVVEDAKGVKTPVYKLKRRMMAERYGIIIKEV